MQPSIGELLLSGVELMLVGMGIVFMFLALLVWVIGFTSRLIQRYSPELPAHLPLSNPIPPSDGMENDESELVAAISAAIHHHQTH